MGETRNVIWLHSICLQNGIRLNGDQLRLFELFAVGLLEWNKKVNLISRCDERNIWERHILHSVCLLFKVDIPMGARVLDLGSGGGLPGVPLKIMRPDLSLVLIDATQKKVNAVRDILSSLGLPDIHVSWGRAEDLGKQKDHFGQYDVVVARAVAPLDALAHWSRPFLKESRARVRKPTPPPTTSTRYVVSEPALVAFKGGEVEDEISRLRRRVNVGTITTIELNIKGSARLEEGEKKLVIVQFLDNKIEKLE